MARLLIVAGGFPSVVYPSIELGRRLAAAGHRVTLAGLAETRALVEHHRLEFLPLAPHRYQQFLEADSKRSTWERLTTIRRRRELAQDAVAFTELVDAVRDIEPDLVLIDGEMHEHVIAASAAARRLVLTNSFVSIWRRPGLPPPHCRVRPGVGWMGSGVGMALLWRVLQLRKRARRWSHWARRVGCDRHSILRRLAHEADFDLARETDDSQWLIPFTFRNLPVLSLHAFEFEFPHRPSERVHYVGPMLLEDRHHRKMVPRDRERLDAILARCEHGERKLIYAGFGSLATTDTPFLRRLIDAVSERTDWELVLTLSSRIAVGELGPLPERAHAFEWLPQIEVLGHADVAVTHGGIHTIDECILAGVPMLVYCGNETDMAGNTERVVYHRIGIAGDSADGAPTIRGHIERLLADAELANNVNEMRLHYDAYSQNRIVESTIASLLEEVP